MASGPLSSLYEDKYSSADLIYPSDLGTNSRKGHWVTFTAFNTNKSSYQKLKEASPADLNDLTGTTAGNYGNGGFKELPPIGESIVNNIFNFLLTKPTTEKVASISLYMPDTISIAQNQQYSAVSVTEVLQAAGQIKSLVDSVSAGEGVWNAIKNVAMENVAGKSDKAAGLLLNQQNQAINPQMELLFTNIDFRTFQFDFLFTPKDSNEARSVRNIIQAFKFYSAPELNSNSAGGRYFVIPSTFKIEFYFNGIENTFIHRLAPSVLTSVVVDHAPQGWVTHNDGSPVQSRLTLQFKETEIMTKQKINEEGY